jgi:glycosyl transferase family 25
MGPVKIPPEHFKPYMTPTVVATALSHRKAYKQFLRDGGPIALICEDDATFGNLDWIDDVRLAGREVALLFFLSRDPLKVKAIDTVGDKKIAIPSTLNYLGSAVAYLITRAAAESLSEGPIIGGADEWSTFVENYRLDRVKLIIPRAANVVPMVSTINSTEWKHRVSKWPLIKRWFDHRHKKAIEAMSCYYESD